MLKEKLQIDPRWPTTNSSGLQLPVKAQRTRRRHTFRRIFVSHRSADSQWRSPTGRQRDSCGRRSGFAGVSAQQLFMQSQRDCFPYWPEFGAPGSQSRLLRTQEGSQTSDSRAEEHHQSYRCYLGCHSGLLGSQHWESISRTSTQKTN